MEWHVAAWPCFDVRKILITAFEFEHVALKPVRKTTNLATMHSLESQKCMACDAWKKTNYFVVCVSLFFICCPSAWSYCICVHRCPVITRVCYCMLLVLSFAWRCFAVFTNVFVVPSDGVSAQVLSRSSLQRKTVRRLVFDDRRGVFVIVCKPCANVTPTCDRLGFQIHLSPWKKHVTCMLWCTIYVCHESCWCCFSFLHHIAVSSDLGSQWRHWSNVWRLPGCLRCVLDDIGASSFCWGMEVVFGVAITFFTLFVWVLFLFPVRVLLRPPCRREPNWMIWQWLW